jgi:hypothetical protein
MAAAHNARQTSMQSIIDGNANDEVNNPKKLGWTITF